MPWAPPTDAQLRRTRQQQDRRYGAERRAVHGPDPRSTARWRRLRRQVLAGAPLCADPFGTHQAQGRVEPATEVDHIQGIWDAPALVWDRANLQALCHACHSTKSASERQGR